ncbi:MAG: hypothetical protein R2932_48190 [Caldilineaceae bacterium]
MPWNSLSTFLAALSESSSALFSGQSAPAAQSWGWLAVGLFFLLAVGYRYRSNRALRPAYLTTLSYLLLPIAIIFGLTLFVTPCTTYAISSSMALLLLILADLIAWVQRRHWILGGFWSQCSYW